MKKRKSIRHHIKHKSKLTLLLIVKIFLAFLSLIVGRAIVLFFEDFFGLFLALVVGFALMFILYLFLITKILPLFKF